MALKVGGTEVITNARQLSNIASVDATTVAALGTAGVGGGGGNVDFTASGSLSNGDLVKLNSNGTVSVVAGGGAGSEVTFHSTNCTDNKATFDSNSNKVIAAFRDASNQNKGKAAVGTVSGTSISFGTPVLFTNSVVGTDGSTTQLGFDTTNNKVGIAFNDSTNVEGRFIVGTVSGTSISFDGEQTYTTAGRPGDIAACLYDDNTDKFVVGYGETSTRIGRANVIQIDTLSTNLTSENFIGFSDGVYANTQSASINTTNTIDRNQSGLTAGQTYFVQVDGTLGLTAASPSVTAGTAISATELIVKG